MKRKRKENSSFINPNHLGLSILPNSNEKPLWVLPTLDIFFEAKKHPEITSFLTSFSEPISRPENIHHYKISKISILTSITTNISSEKIINKLSILSKNKLPFQVINFIQSTHKNLSKAKIIIHQNNSTFIQSKTKKPLLELRELINEPELPKINKIQLISDIDSDINYLISRQNSYSTKSFFQFQFSPNYIQTVKKEALKIGYPLIEEYKCFEEEKDNYLDIELKQDVKLRYYQKDALNRIFINKSCRSGLLILPCGAGKTLTGISIAVKLKESTIILCTSYVAVNQWKNHILKSTTIKENNICLFTSNIKDEIPFEPNQYILITTYNMLSISLERRSEKSKKFIKRIQSYSFGLLLCDEVHVVPAKLFRTVCSNIFAKCKIGLTATLLREDGLIMDLNFLIGPKLYEASWTELTKKGYLANILCKEIFCQMTDAFFREYLNTKNRIIKLYFYIFILNIDHEEKGDKILIFCDNIFALKELERRLNRKSIHGKTPSSERIKILNAFEHNLSRKTSTVIISKVGDVAINLPSANVLIQMSSHFGSRRQETQRLGRILRPKGKIITPLKRKDEYNAFFYTIVSSDTNEKFFSLKRKKYLLNNGYAFRLTKSISHLNKRSSKEKEDSFFFSASFRNLRSLKQQLILLARILTHASEKVDIEKDYLSDSEIDQELENEQELNFSGFEISKKTKRKKIIQPSEINIIYSSSEEEEKETLFEITKNKKFSDITKTSTLEFEKFKKN
eukprot:maker-scaffold_46-snap-gene-1.102-mRNA-1 protein AED:0.13 eAED:0.14 QI:0/0/0/1/0.75/0.6/5/0/740